MTTEDILTYDKETGIQLRYHWIKFYNEGYCIALPKDILHDVQVWDIRHEDKIWVSANKMIIYI